MIDRFFLFGIQILKDFRRVKKKLLTQKSIPPFNEQLYSRKNFLSSGGVRRQVVIDAATRHQIFVRAFLGYAAVFQNQNSV